MSGKVSKTLSMVLVFALLMSNIVNLSVLGTAFADTGSSIVISEVYGGGGNTNAQYKNDFIELYNPTDGDISISGWSVQYASSTGTNFSKTDLSGNVPAHGYYLIQEAAGTDEAPSLPAADAMGNLNLSGSNGKVYLVSNNTLLASTSIIYVVVDMVGYGNATTFEGSGAAPALSNTTSAERLSNDGKNPSGEGAGKGNGWDTNDNKSDFTASVPNPQNTSSPREDTATVVDTTAPVIAHTPDSIAMETKPIKITANITDDSTFEASLYYGGSANSSELAASLPMVKGTGNEFSATLPGQPAGTLYYYIKATDAKGNASTYPSTLENLCKITVQEDTLPPVIEHSPVTTGNLNLDLNFTAKVTDNNQVKNVTLNYRERGQNEYTSIPMNQYGDLYKASIAKNLLTDKGLEYYIMAGDGKNNCMLPANTAVPYLITISAADIMPPEVKNLQPEDGTSTGAELRPVISAEFSDISGIDKNSVKLYLDNTAVDGTLTVSDKAVTYTPSVDLSKGMHTLKLEVSDIYGNKATAVWSISVGGEIYNTYFGQIHSHSSYSDGTGSAEEAYKYARDTGKADFFALTDHSNSYDNDTTKGTDGKIINENITDINDSTSAEWKQLHQIADQYNKDGSFVAIGAYEMTWSGSTGGWGHINTFNTPWFASRNNSSMDLKAYYNRISLDTSSISQLNHPGKTFGDFGDFGFWTPAADKVVNLIEVGNGEGVIGSSGYFPSYDYYTRALDKGWHVAPTNNQDNHKGAWVTANTGRTVVLAPELTRTEIYEAMKEKRVYATEDSDLRILYKVNGKIMGSILQNPSKLDFNIHIEDMDAGDNIGKVSIIADGGTVAASKTFDTNAADWNFSLDAKYSYYYVRIDQSDRDIAVTAPVWTKAVTAVGISNIEISQNPQLVNTPSNFTATVFNNGTTALDNVKVEFFKNSVAPENKIDEQIIASIAPAAKEAAKISWASGITGDINVYAQAVINVNGEEKVCTQSVVFNVADPQDITKVVIDAGHYNQYVSGDYAGKMQTLAATLKDKKIMLVQNNDILTASDLENAKVLIITDPQGKDKASSKLYKSKFTDAEIQVVKDFMDNGGSLIITSRADYDDKGITDPTYQSAAQGNAILSAIGSNLRFNDDEVIDNTANGGQNFRLYFEDYASTKYHLTDNIPIGQTYSAYSGCSVILKTDGSDGKVDWLVKGHDTTEILDSDGQNDATPVAKGQVNSAAAEILAGGGKLIVAGTTFFSDFETATVDNAYSNKLFTDNVMGWLTKAGSAPVKKIAEVRADANNDGAPDLMGKRFAVEGYITAQSVGTGTNNAFFDVIYVQDETGGLTIFGVSQRAIPLGTKVRVSGKVGQYEGDSQIQVSNENIDIEILDNTPNLLVPLSISTSESMKEANEGLLVKIQGKVKEISTTGGDNSLYIDDGSGVAKVYVNGYIGDGTTNPDMLGKWNPLIKVGDTVSAVGLASQDAAGHRIRVRNTAEIIRVASGVTGVAIMGADSEVKIARTITLTAVISPADAENKNVTWTSSDSKIAAVENGIVKGIAQGTAVITVTTADGNYTATLEIKVSPVSVEGISLNQKETELVSGESLTLIPNITPIDATNKNILWTSDNTRIATVKDGVVTGLLAGTATITGTTVDGSFSDSCEVTVVSAATLKVKSGSKGKWVLTYGLKGVNHTAAAAITLKVDKDLEMQKAELIPCGYKVLQVKNKAAGTITLIFLFDRTITGNLDVVNLTFKVKVPRDDESITVLETSLMDRQGEITEAKGTTLEFSTK